MNLPAKGSAASVHLDALRGLSALAVLWGHAFFFFVKVPDDAGPIPVAIKEVSQLGPLAVMAFFVLSGLLVGGGTVKAFQAGEWKAPRYISDRLTRLYVVLIPTLFITLAIDTAGLTALKAPNVFTGAYGSFEGAQLVDNHSPIIFLGNVLFQMTIRVRAFGSDGPLWSLAYEFAYYATFPLLLLFFSSFQKGRMGAVFGCIVGIAAAAWVAQLQVLLYLPVWLLGVAVLRLPALRNPALATRLRPVLPILVVLAAVGADLAQPILAPHLPGRVQKLPTDFAFGLVVAGVIWLLLSDQGAFSRPYERAAKWLAGISYTLYCVHYPFLLLLHAMYVGGSPQLPFGPFALLVALVATALCVLFAWGVWWLFERQTPAVRKWFGRRPAV